MTSLRTAGVLVACVVLSLTTLAASAKPLPPKVRQTSSTIAALAMDGSRVVYASGGKVYVWNVETGTTSVVKGVYSKNPAEVAIAGTRVAWISRFVIGNSYQTTERLYTAPAGGTARQLRVRTAPTARASASGMGAGRPARSARPRCWPSAPGHPTEPPPAPSVSTKSRRAG